MSLLWYYRPEHTQGGRNPSMHQVSPPKARLGARGSRGVRVPVGSSPRSSLPSWVASSPGGRAAVRSETEPALGCGAAAARCVVLWRGFSPVSGRLWKPQAATEAAAFFTWPPLLNFSVSPFNLRETCALRSSFDRWLGSKAESVLNRDQAPCQTGRSDAPSNAALQAPAPAARLQDTGAPASPAALSP